MKTLSEEINHLVANLVEKRSKIKEDFFRAYIAAQMPMNEEQVNHIINSIELIEEWSAEIDNKRQVRWYFKTKPESRLWRGKLNGLEGFDAS